MKSVNCWSLILYLLLLQAVCLQGQQKSVGEQVATLIRDADDIRVVHVYDVDQYTAYQSVLPEVRQALAKAIADAELAPVVNEDGSNDPGELAVSDYVMINVRHKGELVGDIALVAYFVDVIKPGKIWHRAEYKDAPYADNTVPSAKSFIDRRALAAVLAGVKQGSWKKVEGSLKGFFSVDLPGSR